MDFSKNGTIFKGWRCILLQRAPKLEEKYIVNAEHILRAPDARSDKLKELNGQKGFTRLEYLKLRNAVQQADRSKRY